LCIFIAVVGKTEPVATAETSNSVLTEPAAVDNHIDQLVTDNPEIELTLSSCEYAPPGLF